MEKQSRTFDNCGIKQLVGALLVAMAFAMVAPAFSRAQTTVLAPLAGRHYTPAPNQQSIGFYGTDLGFTARLGNYIRILFGDTWSSSLPTLIGPIGDDAQGTISILEGDDVESYVRSHPPAEGELSWQFEGPPITFQTNSLGLTAPLTVYREGEMLNMSLGKTPVGAFSNGVDSFFAMFFRAVFLQCANGSCPTGYTCDSGIGAVNGDANETAVPCILDTDPLCSALPGSGMCVDSASAVHNTTSKGRIDSVAVSLDVGYANPSVPEEYHTIQWHTNKFLNPTMRSVNDFDPRRTAGVGNDYQPADGTTTGNEKVFIWGFPCIVCNKGLGQSGKLYFAYVDMPQVDPDHELVWNPRYFTQEIDGIAQFSSDPSKAAPLDLSSPMPDPTAEPWDILNITVSYVEPIKKWVMLYGGEFPPKYANIFDISGGGALSPPVHHPRGSVLMRTAAKPWGPWTAPVELFAGGAYDPNSPTDQFGPGGILRHPACTQDDCAPPEPAIVYEQNEYGFLYAPNIVDEWTENRPETLDGTTIPAADIYWLVSTWDPYQVVLLKSHIRGDQPPPSSGDAAVDNLEPSDSGTDHIDDGGRGDADPKKPRCEENCTPASENADAGAVGIDAGNQDEGSKSSDSTRDATSGDAAGTNATRAQTKDASASPVQDETPSGNGCQIALSSTSGAGGSMGTKRFVCLLFFACFLLRGSVQRFRIGTKLA